MMNDLLLILSLSIVSWLYAGSDDMEHLRYNFKPFNCPLCFGIWFGFGVLLLKYGIDWKLFYCFIVGYIANYIDKIEK